MAKLNARPLDPAHGVLRTDSQKMQGALLKLHFDAPGR